MADARYYLIFPDPTKGLFSRDSEIDGLLNYIHLDSRYLLISELAETDRKYSMHRYERCSLLKTPEDFMIPDRKNTLAYIVKNGLRVAETKDEITFNKRYLPFEKSSLAENITTTGKPEDLSLKFRFPTTEEIANDINNSEELQKVLIKKRLFGANKLRNFLVDYHLTVPLLSDNSYTFSNTFSAKESLAELERKILLPLRATTTP